MDTVREVLAIDHLAAMWLPLAAGAAFVGLGLFAVTLLKVVLFDMSDVQTGYRVLSFLGLGLLLMGTSVLYGKLSPVLLRERTSCAGAKSDPGVGAAA